MCGETETIVSQPIDAVLEPIYYVHSGIVKVRLTSGSVRSLVMPLSQALMRL